MATTVIHTMSQLRAAVLEKELDRRRQEQEVRRTGGPHTNKRRAHFNPGKGHRRDWEKDVD